MSLNKKLVASPTCLGITFLCNGAFSSTTSNILLKSFIPFAESVFIGPAEIPLILTSIFPKSYAKYLILASNAALAAPIILYPSTTFSAP